MGQKSLAPAKVGRLRRAVEEAEVMAEARRAEKAEREAQQAAKAARGADGRRVCGVPEGCVPFRTWLEAEAARRGLSAVALRGRMYRGEEPWPERVALNKRRHFVRVVAQGAGSGAQGADLNGMDGKNGMDVQTKETQL